MVSLRIFACASCLFTLYGCASNDPSTPLEPKDNSVTAANLATDDNNTDMAPAHLIVSDQYSDVRFVVMMAAHHQHAIDMAEVALASADHQEVRAMAQKMIVDQKKEIEELRDIREKTLDGSRGVATTMNPHSMENSGVPMPSELSRGIAVDAAFLDGMIPHHSGAIQMSSVALRHTNHLPIAQLARKIIDAQADEIATMTTMRNTWYSGINHGFPHAMSK